MHAEKLTHLLEMDILSGERSGNQYLQGPKPAAAADRELEDSKTNHAKADEDLFPIQVRYL